MKNQKEKTYHDQISALAMQAVQKILKAYEEERERELAPYRSYWREMLKEYKVRKRENGQK